MFSNDVIHSDNIAHVQHLEYEKLADNAPWESVWGNSIFNLIVLVATLVTLFFTQKLATDWGILLIAALLLLFAVGYWYAFVSHKYKGLVLREQDIIFKTGMFWQRVTAVPFNRIQHLETHRGLFERKLGLASLKLYTAGGAGVDMKISGLEQERAERIKQHILIKAGLADMQPAEESQSTSASVTAAGSDIRKHAQANPDVD